MVIMFKVQWYPIGNERVGKLAHPLIASWTSALKYMRYLDRDIKVEGFEMFVLDAKEQPADLVQTKVQQLMRNLRKGNWRCRND